MFWIFFSFFLLLFQNAGSQHCFRIIFFLNKTQKVLPLIDSADTIDRTSIRRLQTVTICTFSTFPGRLASSLWGLLYLVQNTAIRIVTLPEKRQRAKPVLRNLHWLPVKDRINRKILSLAHNCFSGTATRNLIISPKRKVCRRGGGEALNDESIYTHILSLSLPPSLPPPPSPPPPTHIYSYHSVRKRRLLGREKMCLHYLQELIPRYEPQRSLRSPSWYRLRIPSVDENHTKKAVRPPGFSPTLPPDSGMPTFRYWQILSLLQLFAGNSRLACFQTGVRTIVHLFVFLSDWVFRGLSSGKETAPVCATSMVFPWMFEWSTNGQSSSSSSSSSPSTTYQWQRPKVWPRRGAIFYSYYAYGRQGRSRGTSPIKQYASCNAFSSVQFSSVPWPLRSSEGT